MATKYIHILLLLLSKRRVRGGHETCSHSSGSSATRFFPSFNRCFEIIAVATKRKSFSFPFHFFKIILSLTFFCLKTLVLRIVKFSHTIIISERERVIYIVDNIRL